MTNNPERFTLPVIFRSKAAMDYRVRTLIYPALMAGKCSTVKIAGRDFTCKLVSYFHTKQGRGNFTVILDDPTDDGNVISFSGENGRKVNDDLYELPIDRLLLNSKTDQRLAAYPCHPSNPRLEYASKLETSPRGRFERHMYRYGSKRQTIRTGI